MRYEDPRMYISMFDGEDDILTDSSNEGTRTFDGGSSSASDAASNDTSGSTYSINVETFS